VTHTAHHGDTVEYMKGLPAGSVQLVVTSPPYNVGKAYETTQALDQYVDGLRPAIIEMVRVLADKGSVCWQVGNYVDAGEVVPLDILFYPVFKGLGLKLRNRVVWHFDHGLHAKNRLSGRYETILWFTKTDDYVFHLDPIRVPSKYPGKTHFKGPNKGKPSGNPLGKNPSDYWPAVAADWDKMVWDVPNVKANHPEKTAHPCQFPVELAERCVLALSSPGDVVLDPFAGAGSTLVAAAAHGRVGLGADKEEPYVQIARDRLAALAAGTLKVRPLGKPVHRPSGNEKVCQVPTEWDMGV
jgi:DNA modification methylase